MTRVAKVERKIEYFPISCEIKEFNDQKYQFGGYLNYKNNIDYGEDRTLDGAFGITLNDSYARKKAQGLEYLYPYLWNHDFNILPPGGIFDANEDKKGLYTWVQLNPEMQLGRELYSSIKQRMMLKQSMGYKSHKWEYVKEGGRTIRNLLEVQIVEGSAVVFPMNDLAQIDTVKSLVPTKDFNATYNQRLQEDWLDDFYILWYSLRTEIFQALRDSTTPVPTIQASLDQFNTALLAYVQQGLDIGIVEALQPNGGDMYYYMSEVADYENKAGRMISDKNHRMLTAAADGIAGHVKSIQSLLKSAQQQTASVAGADDPPHDTKEALDDDAVSTHLDELLQALSISSALRK